MLRKIKKIFLSLFILGLAVFSLYWWWTHREPVGSNLALFPVNGDQILIVRAVEGKNADALVLHDLQKGFQWGKMIPPSLPVGVYNGLSVGEGIITLRLEGGEGKPQETIAFSLSSGKELWRFNSFVENPPNLETPPLVTTLSSMDRLYEFYVNLDEKTEMVLLERTTGKKLLQATLGEGEVGPVLLTENALVYNAPQEGWSYFNVEEGLKITSHKALIDGCFSDSLSYFFDADGLKSVDLKTFEERLVRGDLLKEINPYSVAPPEILSCGFYKNELVILHSHWTDWDEEGELEYQVTSLDPKTGEVNWKISLGNLRPATGGALNLSKRYPLHSPLGGELSRFVLIQAEEGGDDDSKTRLLMLDLENQVVAWEGRNQKGLLQYHLFRSDGRYYFCRGGHEVAVFDGSTGKIEGAVSIVPGFANNILPFHVKEGSLWSFASKRWVRLDAATLQIKKLSNEDVIVNDIMPTIKSAFGIP